ncbi:MAG: hypothetical protein IPJ33_04225 [Gammaproteobacteria bacterium]|nr:hypothetical protein [Gammaproteobacteria bacterium]
MQALLSTPKALSRARMVSALQQLTKDRPDLNIMLKGTNSFNDSMEQGAVYSEILASTEICVVPRGDVSESFRYFEAMRYGCIVVCEPQPDFWFYKNSPAIEIRNWAQLGPVVSELLDEHVLQELSAHTGILATSLLGRGHCKVHGRENHKALGK